MQAVLCGGSDGFKSNHRYEPQEGKTEKENSIQRYIKLPKAKEKLKPARERHISFQKAIIKMPVEWKPENKSAKNKNKYNHRILYLSKYA